MPSRPPPDATHALRLTLSRQYTELIDHWFRRWLPPNIVATLNTLTKREAGRYLLGKGYRIHTLYLNGSTVHVLTRQQHFLTLRWREEIARVCLRVDFPNFPNFPNV